MRSLGGKGELGVYFAGGPTHPRHNVLNMINIFLLLSFWIGVVKAQNAIPIQVLRHPKAHKHSLHTMQQHHTCGSSRKPTSLSRWGCPALSSFLVKATKLSAFNA